MGLVVTFFVPLGLMVAIAWVISGFRKNDGEA